MVKYDETNYKIWFWYTDPKTGKKSTGRYAQEYKTKGWAERIAKERYGRLGYNWYVSKKNIFRKKCPCCGKTYYVDDNPLRNNTLQIRFGGQDDKAYQYYNYTQICNECFEKLKVNLVGSFKGDE